jgi:hypothetical protein
VCPRSWEIIVVFTERLARGVQQRPKRILLDWVFAVTACVVTAGAVGSVSLSDADQATGAAAEGARVLTPSQLRRRRDPLDATVVRALLLPAVMSVLGRANWYFPRALRWLPGVRLERRGTTEPTRTEETVTA